jgi:hypothetical protein
VWHSIGYHGVLGILANRGLQRSVEGFKAFLSFGVELGLYERSEDGFEDGLALGIMLGIHLALGVKLGIGDSPYVGVDNGSSLGFDLNGFKDGLSLDVELGLDKMSM